MLALNKTLPILNGEVCICVFNSTTNLHMITLSSLKNCAWWTIHNGSCTKTTCCKVTSHPKPRGHGHGHGHGHCIIALSWQQQTSIRCAWYTVIIWCFESKIFWCLISSWAIVSITPVANRNSVDYITNWETYSFRLPCLSLISITSYIDHITLCSVANEVS